MITKKELDTLYKWASVKEFIVKKTPWSVGYANKNVLVCGLKFVRKKTHIQKNLMPDEICEIIKNDDIIHASYCEFTSKTKLNPHKDPDIYSEKYKRIHIPLFIPDKNECYMEWTEIKSDIINWEEGKPIVCDVMNHVHQVFNNSSRSMKFLFLDVKIDVEVEL